MMKRFLKKILFFSIPILLLLVSLEFLLRLIPNDYSYKKVYLDKNSNTLEILFLGSSHTYYGINPEYIDHPSFNASHISQTIDLDFEIINKYSNKFEKLKWIVIPIDYFTLFSRTSTGIESWRIKNYNIYYELKLSNNIKDNSEILTFNSDRNISRIFSYFVNNINGITCTKLGYGNIYRKQTDLMTTGKTAAKRHTGIDINYYRESQLIIEKIITYAEKNNKKILFYTNPAYYSYVQNLDPVQINMTINSIDSICKGHKNCFYINFLSDRRFEAADFRDADHMNKPGAEKLTKIMINEIGAMH